jgi:hypothetical protein
MDICRINLDGLVAVDQLLPSATVQGVVQPARHAGCREIVASLVLTLKIVTIIM